MPSLHENVTAALRTLGVTLAPGALDAAVSAAEKESLSHLEFLHRLLAGPAEAKLQRALQRRIDDAKFRELTSLEGFDWAFNPQGVDRRSIEQLLTCDFVRRHENVILVGQTGLAWMPMEGKPANKSACIRPRFSLKSGLFSRMTSLSAAKNHRHPEPSDQPQTFSRMQIRRWMADSA